MVSLYTFSAKVSVEMVLGCLALILFSCTNVATRIICSSVGQCIDHLYVKDSTIRQAGRGAFSRRFLPKGTTIITAPLIPLFGIEEMGLNVTNNPNRRVNPIKLMYNYHFGHPNSTAFFFPGTTAISINHNSNRNSASGWKEANVKLQWASSWDKKTRYFLQRPLEDLKKVRFACKDVKFNSFRQA